MKKDNRAPEQIREHYELEKKLANKLRSAAWEERKELYKSVYDEFFSKLDHLPQLQRTEDEIQAKINFEMVHVQKYLSNDSAYFELGAGECDLAKEVSKYVQKVYIAEVSTELINRSAYPDNFEFVLTDGRTIDLADSSVDLAYSHQLMEHIHPEDAIEQLKDIFRMLKPGGCYVCVTPNRLSGPHDISQHFDKIASGFHLKEYTVIELVELFKQTGFSKVKAYSKFKQLKIYWPLFIYYLVEHLFAAMKFEFRKKITRNPFVGNLLIVNVVGKK